MVHRHTLIAIIAPIISTIFFIGSHGFFVSYTSLRAQYAGYPDYMIGMIQSSYYLGLCLGAILIEGLIRRVGHIRAFTGFVGLFTFVILWQGLYINPWGWVACRFIGGVCLASGFIVVESWLLAESTPATRGRILAIYWLFTYMSLAAGQFLLNLVAIDSSSAFMLAASLCAISALPVAISWTRSPRPESPTVTSLFLLARVSYLGTAACVVGGLLLSGIYSFLPIFASDVALPVSLCVSLTITGGFLLQWPIGWLSDLFDRRSVLLACCVLAAISATLLAVTPKTANWVFPQLFVMGGFFFVLYPLGIAHVCDRIHHQNLTAATSVLLVAFASGSVFGPVLVPIFATHLPTIGLFVYLALGSLLLFGIGLLSLFTRPGVPLEEQTQYVAVPTGSPVASGLDPRTYEEGPEEIEGEEEEETHS